MHYFEYFYHIIIFAPIHGIVHHAEAVKIDEKFEIKQLMEYEAFKDLGPDADIPEGHTKIPVHFVYDVKHDG